MKSTILECEGYASRNKLHISFSRVISRINEEIEIDLKLYVRAASVNYTPEITLANKWIMPQGYKLDCIREEHSE